MKALRTCKRLFIILCISLSVIFTVGCEESCNQELDPETFDDFTSQILKLLIGGDELTLNYYFENPENFGLEHSEPSLPTPGISSEMGKLVINYTLGAIKNYDFEKLNEDQQMTYNLIVDLVDDINLKTPEMGYLSNNYLGTYLGYQAQLPLLLAEYKFRTKLDVENYIKYLQLVPETFKAYVDFEIEKADHNYGMPDYVIDNVVGQCKNFIEKVGTSDHFMITTVNKKIDELEFLTKTEKDHFKKLNIEAVNGPLIEGYTYVMNELPKLKGKATNDMGLAHYVTEDGFEIGKEYYQIDFQDTVGYRITVDDAINYIEEKIAYYEDELEYYKNLAQNDATFRNEVLNYQLMDVAPEEQLKYYESAFDIYFPPLTSKPVITVKYIDKAMEDNFSPAAYMTSAIDNFTEEFIYLNGADVILENGEFDYNYLYTTLAHEGYPGHLYQNVYFKNQDVNVIRKILKSSGYSEGWATYTEIFSYELLRGKYSENFINYLILQEEYNAALHSRMDMGIHYNGWTVEEFKTFITGFNPSITDERVVAAYQQLVEIPNNYQTYFFTYFKFKDLQIKVKEIAGTDFNYQEFHKYILDCGPAPLRFVEEYVLSKYE